MYQLSYISPELYRTIIGDVLQRNDRVGVPLVAVEPGNEINWGAYNGDLDILPEVMSARPVRWRIRATRLARAAKSPQRTIAGGDLPRLSVARHRRRIPRRWGNGLPGMSES
ncbi:hypothetical protein [Ensifer sp. LC163]|uniref:hypothetical protein n=1 Tax=Ensifer sp. LC163 TaxID=1120652 RepID=UPI001FCD4398|nr:hypothetical protein [Ensifer sp. LC163]